MSLYQIFFLVMMQESKLTNLQQRKLHQSLQGTQVLGSSHGRVQYFAQPSVCFVFEQQAAACRSTVAPPVASPNAQGQLSRKEESSQWCRMGEGGGHRRQYWSGRQALTRMLCVLVHLAHVSASTHWAVMLTGLHHSEVSQHECKCKAAAVWMCVGFDSSKEKQRLQNIMSFGSETQGHKVASRLPDQADEPEIDRFDEGLWTLWYPGPSDPGMSWL